METIAQNLSNADVVAKNCINVLNNLLSIIGYKIHFVTSCLTGPLIIQDISFLESCTRPDFMSDATITCEIPLKCGDIQLMNVFARYQRLIEKLGKIEYFRGSISPYWSGKRVSNPYFGCKSLEEALIKRDLLQPSQPNIFKDHSNV